MSNNRLAEALSFFDPVELKSFDDSSYLNDERSIGNNIVINSFVEPLPSNAKFELAFIFIDSTLNEESGSAQKIREELYRLKKISGMRIADLGNLKKGKNINDTLFALQETCALLYHLQVNTVVLGGAQMFTLGNFRAFKEFENDINLSVIDASIDFTLKEEFNETDFINRIVNEESSYLYNVSSIGYQSYFVDYKKLNRLKELCFENYRLGVIRTNIEDLEPVLRDSDLVSFDISAIRMTDAPGQRNGSPNGLYAEEACQLARYAGISDRVQSFGLYDYISEFDNRNQTAKLCAQIVWYYIDGYVSRKHDYPKGTLDNYLKFDVQIDEIDFPIVFYKSEKTGRWWVDVKVIGNEGDIVRSVVAACTEADYRQACKSEIPDRWWTNFKKLK